MNEQRNLIIAIALSLIILFGFQFIFEKTQPTAPVQNTAPLVTAATLPTAPTQTIDRQEALHSGRRIPIATPQLLGSINLQGGVLDDVSLRQYRETPDPTSPPIALLNPTATKNPYYCEFGWRSEERTSIANAQTLWHTKDKKLTPGNDVTIEYNNGKGLVCERTFKVDQQFMFHITERFINNSNAPVKLQPFAQIIREDTPQTGGYFILHEGPIGYINGKLIELDYAKLLAKGGERQATTGGWLGDTSKYWLVALIPPQKIPVNTWFLGTTINEEPVYQSGFMGPSMEVSPGQAVEYSYDLFTGAKKLDSLDHYEAKLGVTHFDLAVDFGWFYFLTKPLFYLLEFLKHLLGNFGLAIMALTVIFKAIMYPLASRSYKSMARMKNLQPQLNKIKTNFENDKGRLQQEMMELYRREKVNPVSGCLPLIIQIPIFFCLYKVLFVTIEMRHTPFYGWIHDLSSPDPTTIFNLFGVIPWHPPSFLMIGAWPIIMGITMLLQQRLNPQPVDPAQAKVMLFMPVIFTFLLAHFPAGLVIYWAWMNILGVLQQWLMMKHPTPNLTLESQNKSKNR